MRREMFEFLLVLCQMLDWVRLYEKLRFWKSDGSIESVVFLFVLL